MGSGQAKDALKIFKKLLEDFEGWSRKLWIPLVAPHSLASCHHLEAWPLQSLSKLHNFRRPSSMKLNQLSHKASGRVEILVGTWSWTFVSLPRRVRPYNGVSIKRNCWFSILWKDKACLCLWRELPVSSSKSSITNQIIIPSTECCQWRPIPCCQWFFLSFVQLHSSSSFGRDDGSISSSQP